MPIDNTDLDMSLNMSDDQWVKDNPVYCPVRWCSAYKQRFSRCGDEDGNYEGIHVARVKYVSRFALNYSRRVKQLRDLGMKEPERMVAHERIRQDAVDAGLAPGKRGRRQL